MRKLYPEFNKNTVSSFLLKAMPCRKICFLSILFIAAGFINKTYAQPGSAWEYSRVVTLAAPTPLADYQVQVQLNTANTANYAGINPDLSDLRFYEGAIQCNYWIEKTDLLGTSIIWVKVPVVNTSSITMYYGNPAAVTTSDGKSTFDFFDDFLGNSLNSNWSTNTSGGPITVSGGEVNLNNNNVSDNSTRVSMSSAFPTTSASFIVEIKNKETGFYRNRFYATNNSVTVSLGQNDNSPGTGDYGYFSGGSNSSTAYCYPNTTPNLNVNTDYLTRWDITDGSTYNWSTYYYLGSRLDYAPYTVTSSIRTINIGVTESTNASSIVDWVRVRKGTVDIVGLNLSPQVQLAPTISSFAQSPLILCSGGTVSVTFNGDNFDNTSQVTFNGVAAQSFTVVSRTQITATSPLNVTSGPIVVTTPGGSVSSPTNLVVNPLPGLFTVGGGGHYCAGGTTGLPITLNGSQNGISYQLLQNATPVGTPLTGSGPALTFPLQTIPAAYTVVATISPSGCNQTMTGAPTVVIDPLPTPFNVTGTGNFCSGGAGLAIGLDNSQSGVNYQLLLGGTAVGAVKQGVTGNPISFGLQTAAGSYKVTATYATGTACSQDMTGSAVVTVNPLPTGTIAVTETSGNGPVNDGKICAGDPITFTAPINYSSYTFKINGNPVSPQPGSNVYTTSSLTPGTPVITVEVVDENGCNGTFNTSVPVSVSTLPTGTFAPDVNDVCPGTKVTFNAPTGYAKYVFKVNGVSPVDRGTLSSYSYTTLANGNVVSVDVTNSNGCMQTFTAAAMIIKPIPAAAAKPSGTTELCAGTSNVTYTVSAITYATSYVWSLPTGASFVGGSTGNTVTVNFSNTASTGNITVAGVNGCTTGTSSSLQVTINPLPAATISGTTTLCQNAAAPTVTFTGSLGTAPYTFSYNINGGPTQTIVSTVNTATLSAPTTTAGSFTYNLISVKDASATTCGSTITGESATVLVNPIPLAAVKPTGTPTVCQSTSVVAYSVTPITYADAAGYHWAYSGTGATIHNGTSNNITIDFAANATSGDLTVYGQNSCGVGAVSAIYHITVNPLPTATIGKDANPKECLNSPTKPGVVFTGAVGSTPYTFTYTVNGGASQTVSTTGGNSSVTVYQPTTRSGTFTYALVSVQDGSTTHCANAQAGSVNVIIDTLPVPVLIGPDQICPDQTLSYTTQSGSGIHNYIWTYTHGIPTAGGKTTDDNITIHWDNNTIPKSVLVNYTDANGCSGNTSVSVVSTSPDIPAFNTSGPKKVCLNSTGNAYQVQTGYSDYVWAVTGGTITLGGGLGDSTTDNSATVTWNAAGPQSISVNFNSGICSAPAPTVYPVTVNTLPTATVATNNAAVCQNGTSPIVTFTGADGAANYTFSYTLNGVVQSDIVSSGASQTVSVPTTGTPGDYIYQLTNVADNNTCSQTQTNAVTVTVHPLPTATISGTTAVCANSTQPVITFTGSNGTAPYTFTYKIGTGSNQTVTTTSGNSVTVPAPTGTPGTYDYNLVSVKDVFGCTQTATGTATITVHPLPTATMTGPTALCLNDAANITFTGSNGTAPYTFTYTIDGGANQSVSTTSGNTVTVPITTTVAHTFTYKLISVQDNSSTACAQSQTGTVSVIVSPVSAGGTLTGTATVCTPTNSGTINLGSDKVGNVIRWESSTDGTTWLPISNVTSSLTYSNLTITTQYRAIIQSGTCTEAPSNAVTITVNRKNGGAVTPGPSGTGTICAGTSGSVLLRGNSGSVLWWEYSTNGGLTWIVDASKKDTFYNFINIDTTTWYRALTQATPCDTAYSTIQKETVNPRPSATISGVTPICIGGSTTLTLNLTGSGAMTGTVLEKDGTNTITNSIPFAGTSGTPIVLTGITPATSSNYTISTLQDANCTSTGITYLPNYTTITVNPLPAPVVITPGNTTICSGSILPLSSVENHAGNFSPDWTSSPNFTIPDNNPTGVSNAITVPTGTIPVGGVVDSVQVTLNVQHPEVNDLSINLGSPDGKIITLAAYSLYGPNLTKDTISSRTSQYPVVTTGSSPYTGTYSAEGDNLYGAEAGNANTRKFTDLFGTTLNPPNGNWILYITDGTAGNTGILQNWTLTIYYHVPVNPINIVWSPLDSLFTDPSATIRYTGDARPTVYAKPSATTIYTGKAEDANSCTTASNVTITVTPAPVVTVQADYCSVPNKVQLTASSIPAASSYVWNTGETTSVINVDEAKLYTVSATTGLHCVGTGFLSIAQELVKNGNFEAGNTGFYTEYGYVAPPGNQTGAGSLYPEGLYAVDTNANNYHNQFFGKDHTTPAQTGKFMILNGAPGTGIIWQETVSVLPNTNYYYSAWGMNLNPNSPAKLQFSVNGLNIGTIADLTVAEQPTSAAGVDIGNWVRFYYGATNGWFSGSATTAVIQIVDLNTDRNGNDFGLDDISFATLSTFIRLTSAAGTDNQTMCRGDKMTDVTYTVGSGGIPTVTGLPNGVIAEFKNGITLTISGTPDDTSGVYNYTITTTGKCANPTTATGQITVNGQKATLSSSAGTDSQVVCKGTPITPIKYTLSQLATGAFVSHLPTGVKADTSGNVITITGSPVDSGTFTYKIVTTGASCNADSLSGTIRSTVQTIQKASGDDNQTLCINIKMGDVVYAVGGTGSGAVASGLPSGVNGFYSGGNFTISGTPTVSGLFNYTITTSGTCEAAAITGAITVSANATVNLNVGSNAAQVKCFNSPIDNINYTITGAHDADVKVTGLPDGVGYTVNSGIVTITGTPTESGAFTYTVTATSSCVGASTNGTITIDPLVNTGTSFTTNFAQLCSTPSGTLTLNGSSGTIDHWEGSTDGGFTWATVKIGNNNILSFTVTTTTYFRAVFDGGVCGDSYSSPYTIGVHNLWTGQESTDWNDANNWSDGNLPSTSCPDVKIPQVASNNYPLLASGTATITNLEIDANASVTVNGTGLLQVAGSVANSGTFDVTAGTIEFNGASGQSINGNTFKNNTIQNLIVSDPGTLSVGSSGGAFQISGDLTFGNATNGKLNTGNNLTLLSTALATANVGVLQAANSITGEVTVERYSAAINNWQFLAVPTQTTQTIHQAWQEDQPTGNTTAIIGYGTQITGPVLANGLDFSSPNPSMKYWNNPTQAFINITRTDILFPDIQNGLVQNGFFLFIRGDRRATADLSSPHFATVMRTRGKLNTGSVSFNIPANSFYSLGNPYASRVDVRKLAGIGGVNSTFYVWDPLVSGDRGAGGYQTFSPTNSYWPTVPTDYYADKIQYPYIESGQAIFVNNNASTQVTLTFNESAKATGSHLAFRGEDSSPSEFIRTFLCTAAGKIIDGNAVAFNSRYKNGIDVNDAIKMKNSGENLGLRLDGVILAVEARAPVKSIDTVYFDLTNLAKETYQFQFNPDNMDKEDLKAYLIDNYLKTTTDVSLSGITSSSFTVNSDAASYAEDRFMVVFKRSIAAAPVIPTPFTFVSLTANQADKDILVVWNVKNENNMLDYEVEKSVDGINFVKQETVNATNSGAASYQWTDNNALPGDNGYRIRSVDKNGKVVYSTVVKVSISNFKTGISIYPNPITDAVIHLQFINQPQGKYRIRLLNPLGQVILAKEITYAGGNGSEDIKWDYKMAHGMYQLEIIKPDRSVHIIKVLY